MTLRQLSTIHPRPWLRRPDQDRLIRHLDMERVAVGLGIDRDRCNPHAPGGLDDAAGDLAAIGNQDSLEHLRL